MTMIRLRYTNGASPIHVSATPVDHGLAVHVAPYGNPHMVWVCSDIETGAAIAWSNRNELDAYRKAIRRLDGMATDRGISIDDVLRQARLRFWQSCEHDHVQQAEQEG